MFLSVHCAGVFVWWKHVRDPSGRFIMKEIASTERTFKADLVLLAMGFLGPEDAVISQLALDQDPCSNVETSSWR